GGAAWLLSLLDGSRDRAQVIAAAVDRGLPAGLADHVLTLLAACGALDDYPAGTLRALTQAERARLAPELADASLAHGDTDGGARILARRQASRIHVRDRRHPRPGGRLRSRLRQQLARPATRHPARAAPSRPPPGSCRTARAAH